MEQPRRNAPYLGLIPFAEEDALFFFGREKETRLIIANLFASPLTLLYGASGVGKSSVLRAGVVNTLRERDELLVVVFDNWQGNPLADLVVAVVDAVKKTTGESVSRFASTSLIEFLSASAVRLNRRFMIVFDQFEGYFLYHPHDKVFAKEFSEAVTLPDLPASFLISIREDAFAKLDRFEGQIPALFDNYLRIDYLDRKAATDAIIKPVNKYNELCMPSDNKVIIEPGLVDSVIEQVRTGQVLIGGTGRGQINAVSISSEERIETPYLQLVMTRLWDEEKRVSSPVLRRETLSRLGGAKQIVQTHADDVIRELSPKEQKIAADIFDRLVTPSGTKIALPLTDLATYAKTSPEQMRTLLDKLSSGNTRILRPVSPVSERSDELRYEIFHDILCQAILNWRENFKNTWRFIRFGLLTLDLRVLLFVSIILKPEPLIQLSKLLNPSASDRIDAAVLGSWEISFGRISYLETRPEWRNIKMEIVLTNRRDGYSNAIIDTQGAKLHTTDDAEYNLATLKTTGASQPIATTSITFASLIPKGYGMIGEFNNTDQIVSYWFQAEIPDKVDPRYVHLPNFNDAKIPVETQNNSFLSPDKTINVQTAGTFIDIGATARVTITPFRRESYWPITNDLITASIVISNLTNTQDSAVRLFYLPITNDGIVGAAYTDRPDCQPKWVAPPSMVVTSNICALVPHDTTAIHMIFWGDTRVVYDTLLK